MLVLSRQKNQRVNFPGLGISVEILEIKGSKVRVGVDAPLEVRILRDELDDHGKSAAADAPHTVRLPQSMRHELRNALHELSLMLHVYRKRAEQSAATGNAERIDAEQMFEAIVGRLDTLSGHGVFSQSGSRSPTLQTKRPTRGKALVVDDDKNERELLAGFLRMCEYDVSTASDGLQALKFLDDNEAPQVILLDMNMPRCDGQAFLRKVRQVGAWDPIHVFVVSGSTPSELGLNRADGYTHWFHKPLDPRLVVEQLAEIENSTPAVA